MDAKACWPDKADPAAALAAEKLFRQDCVFAAGAARPEQIPPPSLPEVAFVGRSNVGKSSLINGLTFRKHLARTSNTPGRTQQINFFDLGGRLCLVDLPGYGYAKVSKKAQAHWSYLIGAYLAGRENLLGVCILIDGRHGAKDSDREMLRLLAAENIPAQLVLTKMDKAARAEMPAIQAAIEEMMAASPVTLPAVYRTSSVYAESLIPLRVELSRLALSG